MTAMMEDRWLPGTMVPEYRPADAGEPAAPELGDDLAVILCGCGRWWQADRDEPADAVNACTAHRPRVIVIDEWEEHEPRGYQGRMAGDGPAWLP